MATQTAPSWFAKNWRDLIRPERLEVDTESLTDTYGKFVCEPLERGFGVTIGNSLRRVLLSSIQGAAVTAVKIEGALHEFTNLPDVVEDVMDIVLNLKGVILRMQEVGPKVLLLSKKGEGEVTAGDIQTIQGVEILNPDHHICTINSPEGRFEAELVVRVGRGYVPAEQHKESELGVGSIPMDAVFSPIQKVNYTVTNARVGQRTDYDKLTMEVWTNGTVRPEDAIAYAAKVLKEQLTIFINFEEPAEPAGKREAAEQQKFNENLLMSVDELELSVRSQNCLKNARIKYIYQLVQKTEQEMLKTKNFGRKSLKEIKEILEKLDLRLGMKLENFPPEGVELPEDAEPPKED